MSKLEPQLLEAAQGEVDTRRLQQRKKLLVLLAAAVLAAGAGYGAYEYLHAARFVSTDNAYTAAETAQVTAAISGIVRAVPVPTRRR